MTFGKIGARPLVKSWTARDYVQDGLVGQFDAIENVAFGTHDTSGSEWVDILNPECKIPLGSGEYWGDDFLFSNKTKSVASVYYNGMLVDWFGRCFKSNDASVLTAFTIEIGVKYDTYQFSPGTICQFNNTAAPFLAFKDTWNNGSYQINGSVNNGEFYIRENTNVSMYVGDFIGRTNVVFALAWTFSNVAGEYAIYNNGVKQTVGTNSLVLTPTATALNGTWTTNIGHTEDCKYMWVRLSNKVRTADEIAHNYAIDKLRFNLP